MKDIKQNISFFTIFKYQFKSIFREKTFLIMYLISISLSVLVGIILMIFKTSDMKMIVFNYYVLIHTCAIVILISMRLLNYFFYVKKTDKTINIISTQHLKRSKIFVATNAVIWVYCFLLFTINYLIIAIANISSLVIFKAATVYTLYLFLIIILLSNFILFLLAVLSPQATIVIVTLIMSFSFISSLPYQFLKTSEKTQNLTFSGQSGNVLLKVDSIYNSFDLVSYVNKSEIAYPNLSKYIVDHFLEQKYRISTINTDENIDNRKRLWNDLGIIDDEPLKIRFDAKISSVPFDSEISDWKYDDKIRVETYLKYKFISIKELETLIENTNPSTYGYNKFNILSELLEFNNFINSYINNFQEKFYYLFDDYIQLESCDTNNIGTCWESTDEQGNVVTQKNGYIELINSANNTYEGEILPAKRGFKRSYLRDIYQNHFMNLNGLRIQRSDGERIIEGDMDENYNSSENFYSSIYNPLMFTTRILEDYFINYTSNYVIATTYQLDQSTEDWKKYLSTRTVYNTFFNFNFLSNVLVNYTYYAGMSYDDIWFDPNLKSNIELESQKNLLLPYKTYNLTVKNGLIDPQSYDKGIDTYWYLIAQVAISLVLYFIAFYKFNSSDLQ
ncbi:hypothetical protein [Spiroplasma endosymbiont of Cantharis lateralis]|uniref:hypothetical protein n=1 Tax=Spiroplasma endosymbiont of Cantharis lateralis TaxID=3066277 RepID=UPI00313C83C6